MSEIQAKTRGAILALRRIIHNYKDDEFIPVRVLEMIADNLERGIEYASRNSKDY